MQAPDVGALGWALAATPRRAGAPCGAPTGTTSCTARRAAAAACTHTLLERAVDRRSAARTASAVSGRGAAAGGASAAQARAARPPPARQERPRLALRAAVSSRYLRRGSLAHLAAPYGRRQASVTSSMPSTAGHRQRRHCGMGQRTNPCRPCRPRMRCPNLLPVDAATHCRRRHHRRRKHHRLRRERRRERHTCPLPKVRSHAYWRVGCARRRPLDRTPSASRR